MTMSPIVFTIASFSRPTGAALMTGDTAADRPHATSDGHAFDPAA